MSNKTAAQIVPSASSEGKYTADSLAKQFYERSNQSTRNLIEGDLVYHGESLVMVKKVDKGTVTLDDGYQFDGKPSGEPWDEWKTKITFWRPRPGF